MYISLKQSVLFDFVSGLWSLLAGYSWGDDYLEG